MSLHVRTGNAPDTEFETLKFPYEPDNFQKHSFQAIEDGQHVLVTAHTGCGKTSVAEYATAFGIKSGKKVIYTSPIKALSMQIYGDFRRKYPDWDIGIKTGDINERSDDAQVVIMTTEILRNILFNLDKENSDEVDAVGGAVGLDLEHVGVVVFDEVHWIKDPNRGTVWEESIIKMPGHIQMVMLSATLPDALDFAQWIVDCKGKDLSYTTTPKRVVPLSHYVLTEKKKLLIMDNEYNFNNDNYMKAYNEYSFSADQIDAYLPRIDMPALFFCFSRKKCQEYANSIGRSLIESKLGNTMLKEFERMLRGFSSSYASMPETEELRKLLFKGIAYHHAGLPPPLKEIVQELFSKGWIKVLFVTETFAAGVNMPAKTTVLCGLSKIDDRSLVGGDRPSFRTLWPEEYGQISGRAGRRGIDKQGTVILMPFNARYGLPSLAEAKDMMCGEINKIQSRFRMDYSYILKNMLAGGEVVTKARGLLLDTANKSLLAVQEDKRQESRQKHLEKLRSQLETASFNLHSLSMEGDGKSGNESTVKQMYDQHQKFKKGMGKSAKKHYYNTIKPWIQEHQHEFNEYERVLKRYEDLLSQVKIESDDCEGHNGRYEDWLSQVIDMLVEFNYLMEGTTIDNCSSQNVTMSGTIAAHVNECNPIMLTELLTGDYLDDIGTFEQLISVLSLFLQAKPCEREILWNDNVVPAVVDRFLVDIGAFEDYEAQQQLWYSDWSHTEEYLDIAPMWVSGMDFNSIIQNTESEIYSGEFVRMMLKLNNICRECVKIAHISQNDKILELLDNHQSKIVRDIVVPQSLYMN